MERLYNMDETPVEKVSENEEKHLKHPFYAEANQYRETVRREQVLKGAHKYPEPFNPFSWSPKELLQHAMQENVDQGHYIYGLYEWLEKLGKEFDEMKDKLEKKAYDLAKGLQETRNAAYDQINELKAELEVYKNAAEEIERWRKLYNGSCEEIKRIRSKWEGVISQLRDAFKKIDDLKITNEKLNNRANNWENTSNETARNAMKEIDKLKVELEQITQRANGNYNAMLTAEKERDEFKKQYIKAHAEIQDLQYKLKVAEKERDEFKRAWSCSSEAKTHDCSKNQAIHWQGKDIVKVKCQICDKTLYQA